MKILYKHAHLILNYSEEILDGSLLIIDNKIEKVSYKEIESDDAIQIDLAGGIIMPANISFSENNKNIEVNSNNELIKDNKLIGFNDFFNKNDSLSFNSISNVNRAFENEELYVVLNDVLSKPKEVLKVIFKSLLKDRIVVDDFSLSLIKYLHDELKLQLTDIVAFISVNPSKLLETFNTKGSLVKGKKADLIFLDKELNVIDILKTEQLWKE